MTVFFTDNLSAQIERGEVFFLGFKLSEISYGSTFSWLIRTDTDKPTSLFLDGVVNGECTLGIIENPTVTLTGVDITSDIINMNFDSANTIGTEVYESPTTSGGTALLAAFFMDRTPINTTSPLGKEAGVILKGSEDYRIDFTSNSANPMDMIFNVYLREV